MLGAFVFCILIVLAALGIKFLDSVTVPSNAINFSFNRIEQQNLHFDTICMVFLKKVDSRLYKIKYIVRYFFSVTFLDNSIVS